MKIHKHIRGSLLNKEANIPTVKLRKLRATTQLKRLLHTGKYGKTMQKKRASIVGKGYRGSETCTAKMGEKRTVWKMTFTCIKLEARDEEGKKKKKKKKKKNKKEEKRRAE